MNWYQGLFAVVISVTLIHTVGSLSCYSCVSTEPGCGKELNIRLQRWKSCPSPPDGGGENFCVKIIKKNGAEETLTRDCLMTVRKDAYHRQQIPTVQRHGYCSPARNNDPNTPYDENEIYCFCNDWNGCNTATGLKAKFIWTSIVGLLVAYIMRLLV